MYWSQMNLTISIIRYVVVTNFGSLTFRIYVLLYDIYFPGTCILLHGNVVHRSAHNKSDKSRHAYTFHVIEKQNNNYSPENWLQEGENAPFVNVYTTSQIV